VTGDNDMSNAPDISRVVRFDADGALQEAAAGVARSTRGSFFRRSGAIVAGGLLAGALPTALAGAQGPPKSDIAILNYALTLEYLEAAFYREALAGGALRGPYREFARVTGEHEQAHVDALKSTLGRKAGKRPNFDFQGTTEDRDTFAQTAIVLEDTGVEAYQGQAPNIKDKAVLRAAIAIHPVEARHAAWIRSLVGMGSGEPNPAPEAFNPAADMDTVLAAVRDTGFIVMRDASASRAVTSQPRMTG
jgi:ferritin-like protein